LGFVRANPDCGWNIRLSEIFGTEPPARISPGRNGNLQNNSNPFLDSWGSAYAALLSGDQFMPELEMSRTVVSEIVNGLLVL
jgi:hypothetical protein